MIVIVKAFHTAQLVLPAALCLFVMGCKPQAPDLERQRTIEKHNEQLSSEISDMHKRIREAGEINPGLRETIDERRQAVNQALSRKAELRRRETTLKLRVIELESRLKTFRDEFKSLQSKAVSQN